MIYGTRERSVPVLHRPMQTSGTRANVRVCPAALCHEARDPAIRVNMNPLYATFPPPPLPTALPVAELALVARAASTRANGTNAAF